MNTTDPRTTWALEREIVLARVFDAPRDLVFRAWTEPDRLCSWFGPRDYPCTTREIDLRVGGQWRFDMIGPDGTRYGNRMTFLEITPPTRLVMDHGDDIDVDPGAFRVTVTFDEQSDGKTVVTLRQLHPTVQQRDAGVAFGAVEIGYTTLDNLDAYLSRVAADA